MNAFESRQHLEDECGLQRPRAPAHAARHLLARPHLARVLAAADAAGRPVRERVAVARRLPSKTPPLHHALEPLADRRACTDHIPSQYDPHSA